MRFNFDSNKNSNSYFVFQLHDFMLKLAEALYMAGVYEEMLVVVCYAFLHPQIIAQSSQIFNNLLFFAALKARNFALAFEFLRFQMTYTLVGF
jgi:hypothetical protein